MQSSLLRLAPVASTLDDVAAAHPAFAISAWCQSRVKRGFDLLCAGALLMVSLPVMMIVALIIKADSQGPVLFRQVRCGRNGKAFHVLKFRTMTHQRPTTGPGLTRSGDARVTNAGRVLRKWKLDELPQLINVVRGEMSLVGPRPDLPKYFAALPPEWRRILQVRPGITSQTTLLFRNEERMLAAVPDSEIENYYVNHLLPRKIRLELRFCSRATWKSDGAVLLHTLTAVLRPNKNGSTSAHSA